MSDTPKLDKGYRSGRARSLFHSGMNCCQAVVMAFDDILCEITGITPQALLSLATGFGGGYGRLREMCGCVSGMTLIAGAAVPEEGQTRERNAAAYKIVQQMAGRFREINGSILCKDLLGLSGASSAVPSERTEEYYRKRPCEELVGIAAGIAAEALAEALGENRMRQGDESDGTGYHQ